MDEEGNPLSSQRNIPPQKIVTSIVHETGRLDQVQENAVQVSLFSNTSTDVGTSNQHSTNHPNRKSGQLAVGDDQSHKNPDSNLNVKGVSGDTDGAGTIAGQTMVTSASVSYPPTSMVPDVSSVSEVLNSGNNVISNVASVPVGIPTNPYGSGLLQHVGNNAVPDLLLGANGASNNDNISASATNPLSNIGALNNITSTLNPYLLATAGIAPVTIPTVTTGSQINSTVSTASDTSPEALFEQNQAIMQQNAAALQHLQQTNNLLATNPGAAATLGMLAPIMNMNLATAPSTTSTQHLLAAATATAPSVSQRNADPVRVATTPEVATVTAPLAGTNIPLCNLGVTASNQILWQQIATQTQQPGLLPLPQQGGSVMPLSPVGAGNSINVSIAPGNTTTESVSNLLRTAFMLQSAGLPILQQPQVALNAINNCIVTPNANNNIAVPVIAAPTNNNLNYSYGNNVVSNGSQTKANGIPTEDANNVAGGAAAAAADAAASVLPSPPVDVSAQSQYHSPAQPPDSISIGMNNTSSNISVEALVSTLHKNNDTVTCPMNQKKQTQQIPRDYTQATLEPTSSTNLLEPLQQNSTSSYFPKCKKSGALQGQGKSKGSSQARPLYLDHDSSCLTAYQCFLRKQIELFEVGEDEMRGTAQGRNTPLQYGQVGIRCRHCAHLSKAVRSRGGVYFSRTIDGVYQVAQNMSKLHFMKSCSMIPDNTKNQLMSLQSVSSRASGGKEYWAEALRVLGVVELGGVLRFSSSLSTVSSHAPMAPAISLPPSSLKQQT